MIWVVDLCCYGIRGSKSVRALGFGPKLGVCYDLKIFAFIYD